MKTTEEIWQEYNQRLSRFIHSRVDHDAADDILQDVFVKTHTRIESLKDDTKLESWLYQITRNAIIDYYRASQKPENIPRWIEEPASNENEPIRRELSSCLTPMIEELPEKYRDAIILSEVEQKTQKEVSELKNISLSGAKSRIQRGRALLKTMLNDCCEIEVNKNNQLVSVEEKDEGCDFC